jgi:curved DNA-binding protein CbpA
MSSAAFQQLGEEASQAEAAAAEASLLLTLAQRPELGSEDEESLQAQAAALFAEVEDEELAEIGRGGTKKQGTYYRSTQPTPSESTKSGGGSSASSSASLSKSLPEELAEMVSLLEAKASALRKQQARLAEELAKLKNNNENQNQNQNSQKQQGGGAAATTAKGGMRHHRSKPRDDQQQKQKRKRLIDLKLRAELAEDGYAKTHPYETLGLLKMEGGASVDDDDDDFGDDEEALGGNGAGNGGDGGVGQHHKSTRTVSQGDIRSAYRRMSLKLHPDKVQSANLWMITVIADEDNDGGGGGGGGGAATTAAGDSDDAAATTTTGASGAGAGDGGLSPAEEVLHLADKAFAALVVAYETLGSPDKRAAFDDFGAMGRDGMDEGQGGGGAHGFQTEWEFEQSHNQEELGETVFYAGHPLITTLSEGLWERRLGVGDSTWVVEFYAPWCSHCQRQVELFKKSAEEMDRRQQASEEKAGEKQARNNRRGGGDGSSSGAGGDNLLPHPPVEFAALNCVSNSKVCNDWFGIRAYPTFLAINDKHGTRQEFLGDKDDPSALVDWAAQVAHEWAWLFERSKLVTFSRPEQFLDTMVLNNNNIIHDSSQNNKQEQQPEFWVVMFTDGVDCQACKTAKTNLLRLAAGLHGQRARVGLVDCTEDANEKW